jgi:hypothetical protein
MLDCAAGRVVELAGLCVGKIVRRKGRDCGGQYDGGEGGEDNLFEHMDSPFRNG